MRRFSIPILAVLLLVLLVGCGTGRQAPKQSEREPTRSAQKQEETTSQIEETLDETTAEAPDGERTVEATTGVAEEPVEESPRTDQPFTAAPEDQGGESGAAGRISEVRYGVHEGYERLVVDFESDGGPATAVPEWRFQSPAGEGYSRITFPGLESTAVSDGDLWSSIMDDFFIARAPDEGFFIDIFATGAFQYRILELKDPGRLAIDYSPVSVDLYHPLPVRGERNVVMQPRPGEAVGGPLTVSGYSRNFEASTTVILRGPDGAVLAQQTVQANDWAETWGYFEASLDVPAFTGEATLQVGSQSPRDGTFEGVEIPVSGGG